MDLFEEDSFAYLPKKNCSLQHEVIYAFQGIVPTVRKWKELKRTMVTFQGFLYSIKVT